MSPSSRLNFKFQSYSASKSPKQPKKSLRPRTLAVVLAVVSLVLTSLLTVPLSRVFAGEDGWILNQGIALLTVPTFTVPGLGPIAFGTIFLRFYALCVLAGALSGYWLALYLSSKSAVSAGTIDRLFLEVVLIGLVGARVVYVLFNLEFYQDNWLNVLNLSQGGLSFFGGLMGVLVYLSFYVRWYKFSWFELLDILAPAVLLGQVIGRWGNFFNYEAYGPATSLFWKMYVPEAARLANNYRGDNLNAEFFHPTFLYESLLNFGLLLGILWFYDRLTDKRSGLVFGVYAVGYGLIRYFTEFFRLDALVVHLPSWLQMHLGNWVLDKILVSQVLALCLMVSGIFVIVKRRNVLFLKKSMTEIKI